MSKLLDRLQSRAASDIFDRHQIMLAYLYGSQARQEAASRSDVDVAVLFRPGLEKQIRFRNLLAVSHDLRSLLEREDVQVVDLQESPPLLRHRVYYDGRLLHNRDDAMRVKFETTALRDYVDTAPLRRIKELYLYQRFAEGSS